MQSQSFLLQSMKSKIVFINTKLVIIKIVLQTEFIHERNEIFYVVQFSWSIHQFATSHILIVGLAMCALVIHTEIY